MLNRPELTSLPENLHLTPEFIFVAACSWLPLSGHSLRQEQIVDDLSSKSLNWEKVAALALRHGVIGQFCAVMGRRGWRNVPPDTKDLFRKIRTTQAVRALIQVAELTRVGRLFAEEGVPLLPLKGVALSQFLYGDPCVRSSCDLDILVRPEDIERAESILIKAGYHHCLGFSGMGSRQKSHIIDTLHHHEYINDSSSVHVELHWRSFLWPDEQVAALWETSGYSSWLNAGLRQFSLEENILFLADHGARHGWPCLKWLSDMAMLMAALPEERWESLYDRAVFFDLQRVLCQTILLLDWFYGIDPPVKAGINYTDHKVVHKLAVDAACQLAKATLSTRKFDGLHQFIMVKKLKPLTSKFLLFRSLMICHSDFVEFPLPDYLFWLYLPLRPYFWFKRHYLIR